MSDELVAGSAKLIGMAVAGEVKGARQGSAIDRRNRNRGPATIRSGVMLRGRVELLYYCEEVGEELTLL